LTPRHCGQSAAASESDARARMTRSVRRADMMHPLRIAGCGLARSTGRQPPGTSTPAVALSFAGLCDR
jgi:hypothetical protein